MDDRRSCGLSGQNTWSRPHFAARRFKKRRVYPLTHGLPPLYTYVHTRERGNSKGFAMRSMKTCYEVVVVVVVEFSRCYKVLLYAALREGKFWRN